jgi:hypothetical protein
VEIDNHPGILPGEGGIPEIWLLRLFSPMRRKAQRVNTSRHTGQAVKDAPLGARRIFGRMKYNDVL